MPLRRRGAVLAVTLLALAGCEQSAHESAAGAAASPAVVSPAPPPPPPIPPPAAAARPASPYPAVLVESVRVQRSGKQARLTVRLSRSEGARRYHVQLADSLDFTQPRLERLVGGTTARLGPLPAGVVYMRARALGPLGEGDFGQACVVDATRSGAATLAPAVPQAASEDATEPELTALPRGEVRSAGVAAASREVGGAPGDAAIPTPVATAVPAAAPVAASAAPGKPRPSLRDQRAFRQRYEKLKAELDAVAALRAELQGTIDTLQSQLSGADAKTADVVRAELAQIEVTRAQLDREIAAGMRELDALGKP